MAQCSKAGSGWRLVRTAEFTVSAPPLTGVAPCLTPIRYYRPVFFVTLPWKSIESSAACSGQQK